MNYRLLQREFHRVFRQRREILLSQLFPLMTGGAFSFLLYDLLENIPQIGTSFYWISQSFSLLLLSHDIFKKDLSQDFLLSVILSKTSLASFLFTRWLVFTTVLTLGAGGTAFLLCPLLGIPLNRSLLLLFPFQGMGLAYGGFLTLMIEETRSYFLALLLLPLIFPLFLLATSSHENFTFIFLTFMGILFLILPFLIGFSHYIVRYSYAKS